MKVQCLKTRGFCNIELSWKPPELSWKRPELSWKIPGSFRKISDFFQEFPEGGFQLPELPIACLKRPRPVPSSRQPNALHEVVRAREAHGHPVAEQHVILPLLAAARAGEDRIRGKLRGLLADV